MKAVVLFEPGPAENLKVVEVKDPERPGEGELLVKVEASGIDGHDMIVRSGMMGAALHGRDLEVKENGAWVKKSGMILGHEIAGTVMAVGPGVNSTKVGDRVTNNIKAACRVCRFCRMGRGNNCKDGKSVDGGYAELALMPEATTMVVPDNVSSVEACIVSCAIGTPLRGYTVAGKPRFQDNILVTGAGGGLGVHALQIAGLSGGFVMATTTTETKVPLLKEYGATEVIYAPEGRFNDHVMALTDGWGADLVIDTVGGSTFNNGGFRSLAFFGRYVFVGQINTEAARFAVPWLFWKEATLTGTSTPDYSDMQQGMELVEGGRIKPVVSTTFRLDETPRMHGLLEERQVFGRAVIDLLL